MDNKAHCLFDKFLQGKTCGETLSLFSELCHLLQLDPADYCNFYHKLKGSLNYWKAKALWVKLDKRASHKTYEQGQACAATKSLVLGAGPCGLRTAIELAFLGAKVIVVEKRENFSRNNVLHLWPFTIHDLRALGAKKFYGKFCSGSLNHISIRQLQLILLKVALILGVEVHVNVEYKGFIEPPKDQKKKGIGWRADLLPVGHPVSKYEFDVFVSAGGGKYVPKGFKKKEMRGKLAIGITANFVNRNTTEEAKVEEISGVAYLYNQKFFQQLHRDTGIDLENIVYYKGDTHYFVMTARKQSLLKFGVIEQDRQDADSLLSMQNVSYESLLRYAREAANFSTKYQLPNLEFAKNHRGEPDVAMFDFTCMYRSENAALVKERHGYRLLVALVGDCLVEPFWPLGTGIARGFLAAFDAAWLVRKWSMGITPLELLAERESIYQLLSQTTPENTNKNISQYSIDPLTRYPNLNLSYLKPNQVQHLYDVGGTIATEKDASQTKGKMLRNDSVVGYEELLSWCKQHTEGYKNVKVVDLTTSWKSGLALCALIHHFRPGLINFESLKEESAAENNQQAFNIAEKEFGISPIMTGREMADSTSPDKLSMFMYLTQFNEFFKDLSPELQDNNRRKIMTMSSAKSALLFLSTLRKNVANKRRSLSEAEQEPLLKKDPDDAIADQLSARSQWNSDSINSHAEQPQEKVEEEMADVKRQGSFRQAAGPSSSEVCYFCKKRVYVVERVSAESQFFHRGCFMCDLCGTTLRLGNYAFNRGDGKFYCTFHYNGLFGMNQNKWEDTAQNSKNKEVLGEGMEMDSAVEMRDDIPTTDKAAELEHEDIAEDQLDNENERERGSNQYDEEIELTVKYENQDIDGGLQDEKEDKEQGVESSSHCNEESELTDKGPYECTEHIRVPVMGHLTSPGRSPPEDMDQSSENPQAFVSHTMVEHQWPNNGISMTFGSSTQQRQSSITDKISIPSLEITEPHTTECLSSHSTKVLHLGDVNRSTDIADCKGASTDEYLSYMPCPGVKENVQDVERVAESSCPSKELASTHLDVILAIDKEKDDCNTLMKKLSLSPSLKHKLARLSVTSESDSEGQEDDKQPSVQYDTMSSGGARLHPGKAATCTGVESGDLDKEWEILDHPSPVFSTGKNRSLKEEDKNNQVYWNTPCPDLKVRSSPNAGQPLHTKNKSEITKNKATGELRASEKPTEKDLASEPPNKSRLKVFSFPKLFPRISRREKKNKGHENSTPHLPKAEISAIQVALPPQKEVKSCNPSDDEQSDEDEEESLSEDEMKSNTEPPIKTKLSPEELAARRETWRLRTFQRRAKQEEMARFLKAQMIQRRLEEIEQLFLDLEQRGIHLEQEMRNNKGEQQELMQSWIMLVQDKNQLLNEESELMIHGRELELEDQKSRLEQDLRRYMEMNESRKTPNDYLEEERIFKEMIEVVKMRDKLVTFLEQQRLLEEEQHAVVVPGAAARDLTPAASITWA
ncbi:F-actin-monooxygenase mical1 isoform X1 [Carcharodon carcharias]|uniref:F-actin-monooxygenase mical1 isoform X1 n=1 Tax=Carcharodon carcharias TaxID=13397 RepID=UPI001B7E0231|nr:F-actin-monooxygenase mical1 isoform X1 [Carcharodon carcharias]XP_041051309.1 F-actin-monooxygenase mical1 isoform X1 [Carcharodon carcharias]XP_041051311.1 F-actin-monooxygenase mical1 isoform X1 [Carcharodon carcharias]XP_041051312.1 F-actin-monooxygenase mical1 isoform X1 [Carcharodon carcharias]